MVGDRIADVGDRDGHHRRLAAVDDIEVLRARRRHREGREGHGGVGHGDLGRRTLVDGLRPGTPYGRRRSQGNLSGKGHPDTALVEQRLAGSRGAPAQLGVGRDLDLDLSVG